MEKFSLKEESFLKKLYCACFVMQRLFYRDFNHFCLIILPKTFFLFAATFSHAKITFSQRRTQSTLFSSLALAQKHLFWFALPR